MTQSFRSIAGEVTAEIYNHKLPATADEFLDLLEPISENIFDLLPCFENCSSLDDVFTVFSEQFEQEICGSKIANDIYDFGDAGSYNGSDSNTSAICPDWFTICIQNEAERYHRYFNSFQGAVGCIVQTSLMNQMFEIFEWKNTDHDWLSVIERQLAISMAVVKWYELTGDLDRCTQFLLKIFRTEGLVDFTTTGRFMLYYLTIKRRDLLPVYYSRFHGSPDPRDFNKRARWAWYLDYLPE